MYIWIFYVAQHFVVVVDDGYFFCNGSRVCSFNTHIASRTIHVEPIPLIRYTSNSNIENHHHRVSICCSLLCNSHTEILLLYSLFGDAYTYNTYMVFDIDIHSKIVVCQSAFLPIRFHIKHSTYECYGCGKYSKITYWPVPHAVAERLQTFI